MKGIEKFLSNLKDDNLYYQDEDGQFNIIEECDSLNDLLFEIQIILNNNLLEKIEDLKSSAYLNEIKKYFILRKDGKKICLTEFIPYIYKTDDEWRMVGDEKFID